MAHTRTWQEADPANTEDASLGASRFRELRVDLRERMAVDHIWNVDVDTDGYHTKATFKKVDEDPIQVADYGIVYTKEVNGAVELFYMNESGVITQLTSAGGVINPLSLKVLAADPDAAADTGLLYVKDHDPGDGAKAELFFRDEDGDILQLTLGGKSYVTQSSNAWVGGQGTPEVELSDGATIEIDASLSNAFKVILAGNRDLETPTNGVDGQVITLRVLQDSTGSRTLTFDSDYRKASGLDLTLSTDPSSQDLITMIFLDGVWRVLSLVKGVDSAI